MTIFLTFLFQLQMTCKASYQEEQCMHSLLKIPVLSLTSWALWHASPYALPPALLVAIVLQSKPG